MPGSKGTKEVVWLCWTANVSGRIHSGRSQFNAGAYRNYLSSDIRKIELGLGHIASVIKGVLKKEKKLLGNQNPRLEYDHIKLWLPASGPREIPRKGVKEVPKNSRKDDTLIEEVIVGESFQEKLF